VVGQGLELAETGQQAHLEVHLVDMAGDPCTTEQQVTAELRSLVDSSVTPTSVAHKTPDFYEVSYQPNTRGRHKLSVQVNDEPVQGSPFLVYVRQAPHLLGRPVRVIYGNLRMVRGSGASTLHLLGQASGGTSCTHGQYLLMRIATYM